MMTKGVNKIEMSEVQIEHILGGCTALIQPVDSGSKKRFKGSVHNLLDKLLVNDGVIVDQTVKCPTGDQIPKWIIDGMPKVLKTCLLLCLHSHIN